MKFAFIAKHRTIWPVAWLYDAPDVSRSGFHAWLNRSPSKPLLAIVAVIAVVVIVLLRTIAPVLPSFDNHFFLPLAWSLKNGLGLENAWANPIASTFYSWHGIVQPWMVAALAPNDTWAGINLGNTYLAAITACLGVYLMNMLRVHLLFAIPVTIINVSVILSFQSRPELAATFLAFLLVAVNSRMGPSSNRWLFGSVLTGLIMGPLFAAHPTIFGLIGVAFAMFGLVDVSRLNRPLASLLSFGIVSILFFVLSFIIVVEVLYGHGIVNLLIGWFTHGQYIIARDGGVPYSTYWIFSRYLPFAAISFLLSLVPIFLGLRYIAAQSRPAVLLIYIITMIVFFLALWRFGFIASDTYYNMFAVIPVGLILTASAASASTRKLPKAAFSIILLPAFSAAAAAQALLGWHGLKSFESADRVREALRSEISHIVSEGYSVKADAAALAAFELPDRKIMDSIDFLPFPHLAFAYPKQHNADFLLRIQAQYGEDAPAKVPGYTVVQNAYQPTDAPLMNRPFNLSYAIYRRSSLGAEP